MSQCSWPQVNLDSFRRTVDALPNCSKKTLPNFSSLKFMQACWTLDCGLTFPQMLPPAQGSSNSEGKRRREIEPEHGTRGKKIHSTNCTTYTILYYTILYYTILCYAMLCYAILYYTILCYAMLCYAMLCYAILYYTILYYTILYYTILYYTHTLYTTHFKLYTLLLNGTSMVCIHTSIPQSAWTPELTVASPSSDSKCPCLGTRCPVHQNRSAPDFH